MKGGKSKHRARKRRSIVTKLSIFVSFVVLISSGSIYLMVQKWYSYLYEKEVYGQVESIGRVIAAETRSDLVRGMAIDGEVVERIMRQGETVVSCRIKDGKGKEVFKIELEEDNQARRGDKEKGKNKGAEKGKEQIRYVIIKVEGDKKEYGRVIIGYILKPMLIREREKCVAVLLNSISQGTQKSMEDMLYHTPKDMIEQISESAPDVSGIVLYDELGNYISGQTPADSVMELEELDYRNVLKTETVRLKGGEFIDGRIIVLSGGKPVGIVRVFYSLESLKRESRVQKIAAVIVVFGFALAGIILSVTLARRFSGPILKLSRIAIKIGEGRLDESIEIKSGDELELLGESFNRMIEGLRERDLVKDTFSRYVSKQVADEILKYPDRIAPGGKKQEVTILFSDVRGFTPFSERHTPEEVIAHLNEYLSAMVDVIFKYEGTLDKYIGDAIMAVFGSPLSHDDDPLRAVKTALEMQERLTGMNKKWTVEGRDVMKIGIGINTGDVIVGNIGDVRRMEYTVIGDNVNLASRIEGLTKNYNCPIIISEGTYGKVKDRVEVYKLEAATVKGKTHAVEIYELLGLKD